MSESESKFRVIVVGGRLVGLTAAHMLGKADIDFVVLERNDTVLLREGAGLAVFGTSLRVLDQLGLWDPIIKIRTAFEKKMMQTTEGRVFFNHKVEGDDLLGHGVSMVNRLDYAKVLYEGLPAEWQCRIRTGKKVAGIEVTDAGVVVRCEDGTFERGSMVIGADGVHSVVRQQMRELALLDSPSADVNDEKPFLTSYRLLWGSAPRREDMDDCTIHECHHKGYSTQLHTGSIGRRVDGEDAPERLWFFFYEKLDKPTRERVTYTKADRDAFLEKYGHVHMTPKHTMREIIASAFDWGITNVEEGTLDHLSWKRMVLVGDAAHKSAPNAGFGYNNACTTSSSS